jgi:geranylgeranyl diphosphate synthase, type II
VHPNASLTSYQRQFEDILQAELATLTENTPLIQACKYALSSQGKRLRPALVLMIADALGHGYDVGPAALCVEYLHTSSLIADDLPCMDDDDMRRGRPSTHRAFNEETAFLASYGLIASAYEQLPRNAAQCPQGGDERCRLAVENVSINMGLSGLTGGQYQDIHPTIHTEEMVFDTIARKTGALFETSLVLGWLFGGGELDQLPQVKKMAHHLGLAFQMLDDLDDLEQDRDNGSQQNTALILGLDAALDRLQQELASLRRTINALPIDGTNLLAMADLFDGLAVV